MKKYLTALGLILIFGIAVVAASRHTSSKPVVSTRSSAGVYVALGDSVAAGVGLADYSDSSACDRTTEGYPNAVASKLNYTLNDLACSGATTQNGILGDQDVNNLLVAPQLKAVLGSTKPALITITIGANDANWTTFIGQCYTSECGSDADTSTVNADVAVAATNLDQALTQIKAKYPAATPKVVVTGYYQLFGASPTAGCAEASGIDSSELAWIAQLQNSINDALKRSAENYSFAHYVPIDFSGHHLCTPSPWIQGLGSKAPYHPSGAGQTAIANQIVSAIKASGDTK